MPLTATLIGLAFLGKTPSTLRWAGRTGVTAGLLAGTLWPMLREPAQKPG